MPDEYINSPKAESIGTGVSTSEDQETPKYDSDFSNAFGSASAADPFLRDKIGLRALANYPQARGQLDDENQYRLGPIVVAIYDLSKDLDKYNELLEEAGPQGTQYELPPKVQIMDTHERFAKGVFYVRVAYRRIYYMMGIKK